ncbi:MAG TPA: substrate-binding domain-containing protein [Opitutaceae bacterium]|nr:substrate-binding domain-containing protein [Opitutaceae bacterium]
MTNPKKSARTFVPSLKRSFSAINPSIRWVLLLSTLTFGCLCVRAQEKTDIVIARDKMIAAKKMKVFYTNKFDLEGLPHYKPEQKVSGTIREWGANYFTDSPLAEYWEKDFQKYQPDVKFDYHLRTSEHAISALIFGKSDLSPLGRQIMWDERLAFEREFNYQPLGIVVVTGSYDVSGWNPPIGVYVNKANPISQLTLNQLDGVFGAERSGGWKGPEWDESIARGPDKNIRTWGQLGLTGEWADKPIHVYGYNLKYHFVDEMVTRVFHGGNKWNEHLVEYANKTNPDGTLYLVANQMMDDLSKDPYAIAYNAGGSRYMTPQTKAVALAVDEKSPSYDLTIENVQARTYPMYADVFFYLNRNPKQPLDPKLKEFLRYILSREGQEQVIRDGKYLPLTAEVVQQELKKLN